jgi:tetratricopeptide (TPR) repeat protein
MFLSPDKQLSENELNKSIMRTFLVITLVVLTTNLKSNSPGYLPVLEASLINFEQNYAQPACHDLANTCERIITMEKTEWIPYYYKAYAMVHLGFMTLDEEMKDSYFDRAQEALNQAVQIHPDESEIHLLQAYIYFARMEINSMFRSAAYYPKAANALAKAKELNPENPRVYYLEGLSVVHKPEFMGGGKEAALPLLEHALDCFENSKPEVFIYPHWGQESTRSLYEDCLRSVQEKQAGKTKD